LLERQVVLVHSHMYLGRIIRTVQSSTNLEICVVTKCIGRSAYFFASRHQSAPETYDNRFLEIMFWQSEKSRCSSNTWLCRRIICTAKPRRKESRLDGAV